ncbi:IS3 family transposase [Vagococcus penaei]|uniref:IS3 family transposase n=1 Tax=Vagococcus penaei TaxID=633807 RepID=UPI000F8957BC
MHKIFKKHKEKALNEHMENFFGILKQEMYNGEVFSSYDSLKKEIEKYIDYYNMY